MLRKASALVPVHPVKYHSAFTIHPHLNPKPGRDTTICSDTYRLQGNTPNVGTGHWTTTGSAVIDDPANPVTMVHNLQPGPNLFRWTFTNGPCFSVDEVIVTRDLTAGTCNGRTGQVILR